MLHSPALIPGNADKAWVPAGTQYLDKQAHEALAPKRPPNSPQGNKCPSPASSRRCRSPTHTSRHGKVGAGTLTRPPWDTWGSPEQTSRAEGSTPCQSPSRAALKKMTASWSPGRKGFVKPELAEAEENRYSHSQNSNAEASLRSGKAGKKKSSPKKAPARAKFSKQANKAGEAVKSGNGGSIWAGSLAGPQTSFLQPILHLQQCNMSPDDGDTHHDEQPEGDAQLKQNASKKKRSKGSRHARTHSHQSQGAGKQDSAQGEALSQNTSPRVYTLDQSPRGSYVSPLRASPRRALSSRLGSSLVLQASLHHHIPASIRSLQFPPKGGGPQLGTQHLNVKSLGTHSSQLNAESSQDCSLLTDSSGASSQYSEESDREAEEEQRWIAQSTQAESGKPLPQGQCN